MQLKEFNNLPDQNFTDGIRFRHGDGTLILAHAQITEVARFEKHCFGCCGTVRKNCPSRFETRVARDFDHRLTATKLRRILEPARSLRQSAALSVGREHAKRWSTQLPVFGGELVFDVTSRPTACLAEEFCCPPAKPAPPFDPRKRGLCP